MALTDSEFSVLNKFAASAGEWAKIKRVSPYFVTRLEAANLIETNPPRTHARITQVGKAIHREGHILRGKGEAQACLVEEINRFSRLK